MRKLLLVLVLAFASIGAAQDVALAVMGVLGETLGTAITVELPNYGRHAVVMLLEVEPTPAEAREQALPVFIALTNSAAQVVSVSIHASEYAPEPYVLVFQRAADGSITVYLDGVLMP